MRVIWKFPLTRRRVGSAFASPTLRIPLPLTGARDLAPPAAYMPLNTLSVAAREALWAAS